MAATEEMDRDKFYQSLRDQQFTVNVVSEDRNSLYRSIAMEIHEFEDAYTEVRTDIHDHVDANKTQGKYATYFEGKTPAAINLEIDQIEEEEHDGGNLALIGASDFYKRNIIVHVSIGPLMVYPNQPTFREDIHLALHHSSGHFDHLKPPVHVPEENNRIVFDQPPDAIAQPPENDDVEMSESEHNEESDQDMEEADFQESEDEVGEEEDQNQEQIEDDDEDDFTKDFPNLDHPVPANNLTSLLNKFTFKYLGNKLFCASRNYLDILILVPQNSCLDTLVETMSGLSEGQIYLLVDYSSRSSVTNDLLHDEDARTEFQVFCKRIELPADSAMHTRSVWLSYSLIVPLILSAMRYSWNGIRMEVLCKKSSGALATHLLTYYWTEMRYQITTDIEAILENPEAVFCEQCAPTCIWRNNTWHFNLDDFDKLEYKEPTVYGFLERFNLFQCVVPVKSKVMQNLRSVFFSNDPRPFRTLSQLFDDNAKLYESVKFSSYLVLVMDGPRMNTYGNLTPTELLQKQDVFKMLYAGCCLNEPFRSSHFEGKSAIFDVLTRNSVIYFVRQKWYKSRDAARTDEAVVIELLKAYVNRHRRESTNPGFSILNKCSSPSFLLRLSPRYMDIITRYCDSEIQIMQVDERNNDLFPDGVFSGNYPVNTPVPMHPGAYQEREFDDVAHHYEEMKWRR